MISPTEVWAEWDAIDQKKRNSKMAKKFAKKAGMKSMGEVRCAANMIERGIPYKYENIKMVYQHKPQKYTPDYTSDMIDGVVEYKGKMTNETRKKLLSIKRCNPDVRLFLVFEKPNNKIRKGSKTTYAQWAEKNGFDWSEHYVKDEWLKKGD